MSSSHYLSPQQEKPLRQNDVEMVADTINENNNASTSSSIDDQLATTTSTSPTTAAAAHDSNSKPSEPATPVYKSLSWLDRLLVLWILLAIIVGILLGNFVEGVGPALQRGQFVDVSIPIAVGLLVMMYPILCKVQYENLHEVFRTKEVWVQLAFSLVVNWIVAPLIMLGLAWAFLPDKEGLRNGLIFVGLARCIAMVLIWTTLARGSVPYCAILVAVNSLLQLVLYAPLAILFVNIISGSSSSNSSSGVSYAIVARSVGIFLGIPLLAAILTRLTLRSLFGGKWYDTVFLRFVSPWSLIGLLYTVLVLFASQGERVVHQIVAVLRVSAPLVVYFMLIFGVTLWVSKRLGFGYALAATQSFTAASNNFELAIAVTVATFGPASDEALAATVGPLIEVPVLLGLVYGLKWVENRWRWGGEVEGDGLGGGDVDVDVPRFERRSAK